MLLALTVAAISTLAAASPRQVHAVDTITLNSMFGGAGFIFKSDVPADRLGQSVAIVGDINADGFDDLLVGASAQNVVGAPGVAYVLFGHAGGFAANVDTSILDGSNGFMLSTAQAGAMLGYGTSGIGDFNGDGIDDFAVSAPRANVDTNAPPTLFHAGKVYVVFGHVGPFPAVLNLDSLNGGNGFRIEAAHADSRIGYALAAAGDFNGDGRSDIIIGSHGEGMFDDSFVVLGAAAPWSAIVSLSDVASSGRGFRLVGSPGTESGRAVAGIGDVNADGKDEVVVGAPATTVGGVGNAGRTFVVFGRETTPGGNVLSLDSFTLGVVHLDGNGPGDFSGSALAGIGDINGDGTDDFVVGTPGDSAYVGGGYVVFGGASLASGSLADMVANGQGFRLGLASGYNTNAGASVAGPGDINGDGIADFMVAIPGGLPSSEVNREVAVLFGHDSTTPWPAYVDLANVSDGMRLEGTTQIEVHSAGDLRGTLALAGGGDINGDGRNDMVVGSPRATESASPEQELGRAYVVFGRSGPPPDQIFSDGFEGLP